MTDPIADMLTRIRNAITAKHEVVEIPASNMKKAIADILFAEGYVKSVKFVEDGLQGKIVVNTGLGDIKDNAKSIQVTENEIKLITGQQTVQTKAKKSVANFKVREGQTIGIKVTLRDAKMYDFFDRLVSIALPRVRDFRGVSPDAFDGRGNYSLGLKEQLIFPEITYDQVDKIRGMDVCFVTTAQTDEEARELLRAMGMPFKK